MHYVCVMALPLLSLDSHYRPVTLAILKLVVNLSQKTATTATHAQSIAAAIRLVALTVISLLVTIILLALETRVTQSLAVPSKIVCLSSLSLQGAMMSNSNIPLSM